jgi:hypothetical protein
VDKRERGRAGVAYGMIESCRVAIAAGDDPTLGCLCSLQHRSDILLQTVVPACLSSCPTNTHISTSNNNPGFILPQNIQRRPLTTIHLGRTPPRSMPNLRINPITSSHCHPRFHPSLCITLPTHIKSIISRPSLLLIITQSQHRVLNIHSNCLPFNM